MPELPEVETIRRQLEGALVGLSIEKIDILVKKSFQGDPSQVIASPIVAVDRRGKHLTFKFENGCGMMVHLKMSGQLLLIEDKEDQEDKDKKYTRVKFKISNGGELWFCDLRKFGWMRVIAKDKLKSLEENLDLGVEPLTKKFTVQYLQEKLSQRPKVTIKQFLLDQTEIAGIGNIYADEALFAAMIKPTRRAGDLTAGEISNLHDCIQEVLEKAILLGGSSDRSYVQADGSLGRYLVEEGNVYHRQGQICRRCGQGIIERTKISGRSSHFCPFCQR